MPIVKRTMPHTNLHPSSMLPGEQEEAVARLADLGGKGKDQQSLNF